ncbi:hypothetical protein [Parvularcula lutaonensis]|uniref:Uncharacterized protein n=1 Tax=Parvularcula lutaonensis TaxID=491923 RepID=A0ABV7MDZ3_9PROT|nr:hypothetical protein [Parvularcula lutaonensis]GGY51596.1 hypothetical protein GCM10007148_20640 [Parvularcula lutaonensis]
MEQNFALYTDAILVMASLGAALYCLRLHQQLKRFQRADRGVGEAIKRLTEATRLSQSAAAEIRDQVKESLAALDARYGDLQVKRQEVDDLLDAIEGQMGQHMRRCTEARQLTEQALTPLVHKAEMEIHALTKALEVATRLRRLHGEESPVDSGLNLRTAPDAASATGSLSNNPFLRAVGE